MSNKIYHDKNGGVSSKRVIILFAAIEVILMCGIGVFYYIYIQISKEKVLDMTGITSIAAILSSLITLIATLSIFEKKDK
jgi:uncharacterized BrkB/YihY/UPF0761 family membrane protein